MQLPRLKTLRQRAALSQVELAGKADVSVATIQRIEAGHPARYANIRKLAAALGVAPAALMEPAGVGEAERASA